MTQKQLAQGTVSIVRHESEVLRGNPLGDPHIRDLIVYLPPGYEDSAERYPVTFCLAGFGGRGRGMLNDSAFAPNLPERMDKLINAGTVVPMIVVMPDCMTRYGGSQYLNSTATGRYEDYVSDELVRFVDANFRTNADRRQRAVMGKSSGGFGALVMGMRHADVFGSVCSISGDMYFEYSYLTDFCKACRAIKHDPDSFVEDFLAKEVHGPNDFSAMNAIAMSACYSPVDENFELPFDPDTGELKTEVWERWLAHDPVRAVENHVENLRSLELLFLDAGRRDEFYLDLGARILDRKLDKLGIDHIHEEFDGGHFNVSYRYDRSLELISKVFSDGDAAWLGDEVA